MWHNQICTNSTPLYNLLSLFLTTNKAPLFFPPNYSIITSIFSQNTIHPTLFSNCSYNFPMLGDVVVSSDAEPLQDDATLRFIITALPNSTGTIFKVASVLSFYNTDVSVNINAVSQECKVILPTISAETGVSRT